MEAHTGSTYSDILGDLDQYVSCEEMTGTLPRYAGHSDIYEVVHLACEWLDAYLYKQFMHYFGSLDFKVQSVTDMLPHDSSGYVFLIVVEFNSNQ